MGLLKAAARANLLATPPDFEHARTIIGQILLLEGSAAIWRISLRLAIKASIGAEKIVAEFRQAALCSLDEELIDLVYEMPSSERPTAFRVLEGLAQEASMQSHETSSLRAKILKTAILLTESDATIVLLETFWSGTDSGEYQSDHSMILPVANLDFSGRRFVTFSREDAFICTVHLWHLGDQFIKKKDFGSASAAFLFWVDPSLEELKFIGIDVCLSKSALCLLEAGRLEDANSVINRSRELKDGTAAGEESFLHYRVALLRRDLSDAREALAVIASGSSDLKLLDWCIKAANEQKEYTLLGDVMRLLLIATQRSKTTSELDAADMLCIVRTVFRYLTERDSDDDQGSDLGLSNVDVFIDCLHSALPICQQFCTDQVIPSIENEMQCLHETSYNYCLRARLLCPAQTVVSLFKMTAGLLDLAQNTTKCREGKKKLLEKAMVCRLAAIAMEIEHLKQTETKNRERAKSKDIENVSTLLARVKEDSQTLEASLAGAAEAILATEVELACMGKDDSTLAQIFEDDSRFDSLSVETVQHLTGYILDNQTEVSQAAVKALQRCFKVSFSRRKLDTPKLASWLRLMVHCQLDSQDEQAFAYIQSAVGFVESDLYPMEEAEWLSITAWNKGLDFLLAGRPELGFEWCGASLQISQAASLSSTEQLERDLRILHQQFASDGRHQGDVDMAIA
ncbi:sporulation-specific protein 22 [Microbotryomycetes sp. JL201]|nr:sporulation-specific protein 22 [Microbotryomycetes sp. JL201]